MPFFSTIRSNPPVRPVALTAPRIPIAGTVPEWGRPVFRDVKTLQTLFFFYVVQFPVKADFL